MVEHLSTVVELMDSSDQELRPLVREPARNLHFMSKCIGKKLKLAQLFAGWSSAGERTRLLFRLIFSDECKAQNRLGRYIGTVGTWYGLNSS